MSWILGYRPVNSRRFKRLTLGELSALSLKAARQRAKELSGDVVKGGDPVSERVRARRAETVAEMGSRYLDHIDSYRKSSTASEYRRLWKKHLVKTLGNMKVAEVTTAEVSRLHRSIKKKYVANRVVDLAGSFFSFCEKEGIRARGTNPATHVERHREKARERFLTPKEFARLGAALVKAEQEGLPPAPKHRREPKSEETTKHRTRKWGQVYPANPSAVACLRFLALTGLRRGEALQLRWADIDLDRAQLTLAESKTGRSHRPLSAAALLMLTSLPRSSEYVFPGFDGGPIVSVSRIWASVIHAAGLEGLRIHDLRHSYASVSASSGDSMLILRRLLGHKTVKMTERYAHLAPDPVYASADRTSGDIAAWMNGSETSTTVLPLTKASS
jgi:integrase